MESYYASRLAAERLRRCYEIASPAIRMYLQAEIDFVLEKPAASGAVLELGCGYGRVLEALAPRARRTVGIDTSFGSLLLAREAVGTTGACGLVQMDAGRLGLASRTFDLVVCIQNGISAFRIDRLQLLEEAVRVVRKGGMALFSSYCDAFWGERLEWFRAQAREGLIGEIDPLATRDGVIVCKDGFVAETVRPAEFRALASACGVQCTITEVAGSSLVCQIEVP